MSHQPENLTCAQCAYPLKGIAQDAACPECGLGIIVTLRDIHTRARMLTLKAALLSILCAFAFLADFFFIVSVSTDTLYPDYISILSLQAIIHILLASALLSTSEFKPRLWQFIAGACWIAATIIGPMLLLLDDPTSQIPGAWYYTLWAFYELLRNSLWLISLATLRHDAAGADRCLRVSILAVAIALTAVIPLLSAAALAASILLNLTMPTPAMLFCAVLTLDIIICTLVFTAACMIMLRRPPSTQAVAA